jgi:hypothetical protein
VPKSRRRKKEATARPPGVIPITPLIHEALLEQRKAFIAKFGREPGPDDPIFFDPDQDVPMPIETQRLNADLEAAIRDAGFDPAKAEAIRKLLRY